MLKRDHIAEHIDFQVRSRFPHDGEAVEEQELYPGPKHRVMLDGKWMFFSANIRQPGDQLNLAQAEDSMIEAIDRQYANIFNRDYNIVEYLSLGYTQAEVGRMFGVSQQRVYQILKKLKED